MESFHLYLNSHHEGSSSDNTANNFRVDLSHAIELDGEYKVALEQMFYDSFAYTLTNEKIRIYQRDSKKNHLSFLNHTIIKSTAHGKLFYINLQEIRYEPSVTKSLARYELSPALLNRYGIKQLGDDKIYAKSNTQSPFTEDDYIDIWYDTLKEINVGFHQFVSIEDLIKHLNTMVSQFFVFKKNGLRLKITKLKPKTNVTLYNDLNVTLGLAHSLFNKNIKGEYRVQLQRNTKSLYIYIDFIESTRIGNIDGNILKILPYRANSGQVTFNAQIPQYFKVTKNVISSIHTQIRSETGDPFHFLENSKATILLHFHKQTTK